MGSERFIAFDQTNLSVPESFGFGLDFVLYLVAFSVEDGPEGVVRVLGEFLRQDSNHLTLEVDHPGGRPDFGPQNFLDRGHWHQDGVEAHDGQWWM